MGRVSFLLLLALTSLFLLAGCSGEAEKDYGTEVTDSSPKPKSVDQQIEEIRADPKMPQAAKDAAIAGLQRSTAHGNAEAAVKNKK